MRNRIIGVADSSTAINFMRPWDFSDKKYEGVRMYKAPDGKLAVLMQSKRSIPQHWKVVCGICSYYFLSREKVVDFCKRRGYTM